MFVCEWEGSTSYYLNYLLRLFKIAVGVEACAGPNLSVVWGCYLPHKVDGLSLGSQSRLLH